MAQYKYLDEIATADIAFEAWGKSIEEMFIASLDATMNVMVEDIASIAREHRINVALEDDELELLLYQFLQEAIYLKDAKGLFLRAVKVRIQNQKGHFILNANLYGEKININKHRLLVDIKAVTLHQFKIQDTKEGWKARVVLDI